MILDVFATVMLFILIAISLIGFAYDRATIKTTDIFTNILYLLFVAIPSVGIVAIWM